MTTCIFKLWFAAFGVHIFCKTASSDKITSYQMTDKLADVKTYGVLRTIGEYKVETAVTRHVKKRAVSRAVKGLAAAGKLLTEARRVKIKAGDYRLYMKDGNAETALNDFYSVRPKIVSGNKNRINMNSSSGKRGNALVGIVGDRRLILLTTGDKQSKFSPVLEIRSATDALHDRIVYTTRWMRHEG